MRYVVVCVGVILGACSTPTDPNALPDGAEWLEPVPAEYAEWWRALEGCSGLRGDFATVRFVVWPDRVVIPDTRWMGYAHTDTRIIELAGRALGPTIRHEMLHMLGVGGHPEEFFVRRCGEIITNYQSGT